MNAPFYCPNRLNSFSNQIWELYRTFKGSALQTNQIKMLSFFYKVACLAFLSTLNWGTSFAQIIDLESENPYKKVFVDTDNFGPSYLKILEKAYPKIKSDTIRLSVLHDLAYYWHTRNLGTAMKFVKEGLGQSIEQHHVIWEGRFMVTQGAVLLRMEKLDSAEVVLNEARAKVAKRDLAFLNTQLGYVYERRGRLDKATDYAEISLRLGKELRDRKAIALAYSDLSNLFWKQSKAETGLEYALKSLEIFEEIGITDLDYDFTLYVAGNNYLSLKEYEKAKQYYEHALIIGERYGFYNNLSDIYISLLDLYVYLNTYQEAEEAGVNAVKYAKMLSNDFLLMRSWLSIGKMNIQRGDYTLAIKNLRKSIDIATEDFGDGFYLAQAYEGLGRAYAGNHDYQQAYKAMAEYDRLKAQIFTAEADQRTSLLRTELDLADKEGQILHQESLISRQKTRQTLFIIIAILMLLLLLLSYQAIANNVRKNRLLQKQNNDKEFLIMEIHHRVKNNLEMVSSLLSLHAAQIKDKLVSDAMLESQHRVLSMAMIHQKLYTGKHLTSIEMKDYFENLLEYTVDAFGMVGKVAIEIDMPELELDVDAATPIGLIVNELVTNSLKYAFPDHREGKITVGLHKIADIFQLKVIDDGVGFTAGDEVAGTGFGTQLIALLTKQLDGKMNLKTSQGTSVSIQFQIEKAA